MRRSECWLTETWTLVQGHLPDAPARVVELGCGSEGGIVPALLAAGYDTVGVDPRAPEGAPYVREDFQRAELGPPVDAIVACVSLHHVDDLDQVVDRVVDALVPSGIFVVVEWGWERFDLATARWCFDRLPAPDPDAEPGWLERHRQRWEQSELPWSDYIERWAAAEELHPATDIVRALDERFGCRRLDDLTYFFCDLEGTDRAAEQAAIASGDIQATGLRYVGRPSPTQELIPWTI